MRAMKEALLECTDEDLNNDGSKPDWAGKTIYELLCGNIDELKERSKSRSESRSRSTDFYESAPESNGDVIVGQCLLEHDLTSFSKHDDEAKIEFENGGRQISSILEDGSTSSLRALERGDSGEEEQLLSMQLETSGKDEKNPEREVRKRDKPQTVDNHDKESTTSSASQVPPSPEGGESQMGIATSEFSSKIQLSQDGGETQLGTSLAFALSLFEHPAVLAACYCLACLHQMTGLDFVTSLGVLLAMISMVSMFFF
jgi:hypothetical protein